jgi:hypothetical protein
MTTAFDGSSYPERRVIDAVEDLEEYVLRLCELGI